MAAPPGIVAKALLVARACRWQLRAAERTIQLLNLTLKRPLAKHLSAIETIVFGFTCVSCGATRAAAYEVELMDTNMPSESIPQCHLERV
eukprot:4363924-Amphidinium_carterae.1